MRFARPSQLRGQAATITSSGAVDSQYPLTNLRSGNPIDPCRWTVNAETRIVFDHASATSIQGVLIVAHTIAAAAVVKVQAHTSDSWGAPAYSKDIVVPAWPDHLSPNLVADLRGTLMDTTGYRYTSVLLPAQTDDHAIGEMAWIGVWTELDSSIAWPVQRADVRRVNTNRTSFGVEHVVERRVRQRRLFPSLEAVSDADRERWFALLREAGANLAFPVVLDVHETTDFHATSEALWMRFNAETAQQTIEQMRIFARHDLVLDLLEVQRGLAL